ncbi:hypothetical protein pb186bvf_002659 [Paramecium bursaria]
MKHNYTSTRQDKFLYYKQKLIKQILQSYYSQALLIIMVRMFRMMIGIFQSAKIRFSKKFQILFCKQLIYGYQDIEGSSYIPMFEFFLYHFIGQEIDIHEIIQKSPNPIDCYFNIFIFKLIGDIEYSQLSEEKYILQQNINYHQRLDLQKSHQDYDKLINIDYIMVNLIQLFDTYRLFLRPYIGIYFVNSYQNLKKLNLFKYSKNYQALNHFCIIYAFMAYDYQILKQLDMKYMMQIQNLIFQYIDIDHEQYSIFLSLCNSEQRNLSYKQLIKFSVQQQDYKMIKIKNAIKAIKKICLWKESIKLCKQRNLYQLKQVKQYLFLNQFEHNQFQDCIHDCLKKIQNIKLARNLFLLLIIQFIRCNNQQKDMIIQLFESKIDKKQGQDLLHAYFIADIKDKNLQLIGDPLIYRPIISYFKNMIENSGLQNLNLKYNQKNNFCIEYKNFINIKKKFKCLCELIIITYFIRKNDYSYVQYLNPNFISVLLNMITQINVISPYMKSYIFKYFGFYQQSYNIAMEFRYWKIIADIHLIRQNDDDSIKYYQIQSDNDSYYQLGVLYHNKAKGEKDNYKYQQCILQAIQNYGKLIQSKDYEHIAKHKIQQIYKNLRTQTFNIQLISPIFNQQMVKNQQITFN